MPCGSLRLKNRKEPSIRFNTIRKTLGNRFHITSRHRYIFLKVKLYQRQKRSRPDNVKRGFYSELTWLFSWYGYRQTLQNQASNYELYRLRKILNEGVDLILLIGGRYFTQLILKHEKIELFYFGISKNFVETYSWKYILIIKRIQIREE